MAARKKPESATHAVAEVRVAYATAPRGSGVTPLEAHDEVIGGIPVRRVSSLQKQLDLSAQEFAPLLGTSRATLNRITQRAPGESLDTLVGTRLVRLERILDSAERAIGNREAAARWLRAEQRALAWRRPLDVLTTEQGSEAVEDLLGRIEYGVYT